MNVPYLYRRKFCNGHNILVHVGFCILIVILAYPVFIVLRIVLKFLLVFFLNFLFRTFFFFFFLQPFEKWLLEFEQQAATLSQSSESLDNFEELLEQKQKEYLDKQRHYENVLQETVSLCLYCFFNIAMFF